ncbi:MAG TPA: hypothetical protein VI356_08215 [Myxococcales bacterium]
MRRVLALLMVSMLVAAGCGGRSSGPGVPPDSSADRGGVADAGRQDGGTPDGGAADAGPLDGGEADAGPTPGCPGGGVCTYLVRTAWAYDCVSPTACTRAAAIRDYGTFEACQTWGCMNGNSRCGDQFGNSDADRWSCEACKVSCHDGLPSVCPASAETAQGCVLWDSTWGQYLAECICR